MKPQTDYWKSFWDEQARGAGSDYALNRRTSVRVARLEEESLKQFVEAVDPRPGDVVLDAGCGSGRNISILSPLVKEIVGMDYAEHMLVRAGERVAQEKLNNVKLMPGDVTRLQFPSNTFDKVVCASVLQYLDDEDCALALREMVRVCKSGGTLVMHIKNGASLYGVSLKLLRPVARLFGRQMKPEFYRSRRWHERTLQRDGATVTDYDGFGILTFVPLPQRAVGWLLNCEMCAPVPRFLKKGAVNYKMTVRVSK
jgi:ubiquinone/menaquinone biosynthesis C-methylase UbiE